MYAIEVALLKLKLSKHQLIVTNNYYINIAGPYVEKISQCHIVDHKMLVKARFFQWKMNFPAA